MRLRHFQGEVKRRVNQQVKMRRKQQLQRSWEAVISSFCLLSRAVCPSKLGKKHCQPQVLLVRKKQETCGSRRHCCCVASPQVRQPNTLACSGAEGALSLLFHMFHCLSGAIAKEQSPADPSDLECQKVARLSCEWCRCLLAVLEESSMFLLLFPKQFLSSNSMTYSHSHFLSRAYFR